LLTQPVATSKAEVRVFWLCSAVLSVVVVGAVWCVDYLPTNDGPQHVFQSFAAQHLDDVQRGYARYLERGTPVSSLGFDSIYGAALRILPWRHALRVALSVNVLMWSWGVLTLALAIRPARRWLGLLGFAAAFQWSVYMGFFSFHLATGLGFFIVAFALRRPSWRPHHRGLLASMLLLQALAHVFAASLTGLALGMLALSRSPARRRLREWGWMCLTVVPVAGVAWFGRPQGGGLLDHADGSWSWTARLGVLASCFLGGPAWRAWPVVVLALAGGTIFAVSADSRRDPDQRALFIAGGLFLALSVLAPFHLPNWNFFALRFLPCALIYLALLLPAERLAGQRIQALSAVGLATYALASLSWAWGYHQDLRRRSDDALSGLDARIVRSGPRLPLIIDPLQGEPFEPLARTMPFVVPSLSVDMLYVTEQGGVSPNQFIAFPTLHPVVWRHDPEAQLPPSPPKDFSHVLMNPSFDPARRVALLNYVASYAPWYEDILVLGNPADTGVILQRGFEADWAKGRFTIARFRGCPLRILISGAEHASHAVSHAILVQAGWYPASRATFSTVIEAATRDGAELSVPVQRAPCGKVWVQIAEDLNDDQRVSAGDRFCRQAGDDGRFIVDADLTHSTFHCQMGSVVPAPNVAEPRPANKPNQSRRWP
jgi:hypothetical protein